MSRKKQAKIKNETVPYGEVAPEKKMSIEEWNDIAYGEWWRQVDMDSAKKAWAANLERCRQAVTYHEKKGRPLEVLVVHGSGRHPILACSHEVGNSELILEKGLEAIREREDVAVTRVRLREFKIEFCNKCVSTASPLCGFPCDCFPNDPMHQLYPLVLRCDVLLVSSGVNQSAMSDKLKAFCDRLISLDGGFLRSELPNKNYDWRAKMMELGTSHNFSYDQRLFGRVAAYFIASKDQNNEMPVMQGDEFKSPLNYGEGVAWSLLEGFRDFGFYHNDPWYVVGAANPDEDYSYDKEYYHNDVQLHSRAKEVVAAAISKAEELRASPPEWDGGSRVNRT